MKKKDLLLFIIILAAAAIACLALFLFRKEEGSYIELTVGGEYYGTYDLGTDQIIEIDTENGHNVLVISSGAATMVEADCPDGYCMDQGSIDKNSQTIVCLPNKVVAEVITEDEEESYYDIDGIAN